MGPFSCCIEYAHVIYHGWTVLAVGLDTNIPKNALKIFPEILNFFPKNLSKNL